MYLASSKKERRIKAGIQKSEKMANFLTCERPKQRKIGFSKCFLNSVSKPGTICLYSIETELIRLNINYLKLIKYLLIPSCLFQNHAFHVSIIMTAQRHRKLSCRSLTQKLLEFYHIFVIFFFFAEQLSITTAVSFISLFKLQPHITDKKINKSTPQRKSIVFIRMVFPSRVFTYLP